MKKLQFIKTFENYNNINVDLFHAIYTNDLETLNTIISNGADINSLDDDG